MLADTLDHPPPLTLLCDTLVGLPWLLYSGTLQQHSVTSGDLGGAPVEDHDGEAFLDPHCRPVLHTLGEFLDGHG